MSRVYFHIDLNAFFANAEILLDPELKGRPLAVSGHTRRSVVSTASYEARAFGVHSAQSVQEALKLCPDLVIREGHYGWYLELSKQFMSIVRSYTELVEQASIDECYADVTDVIMRYPRPLDLAWQMQQRILSETGIPCSIGVGPNMFLAKMASDMKKPMGITVLRIRDVPEKMWPLDIGDMRGVGKKTLPVLKDMGINTIGDLAHYPQPEELRSVFGKNTDNVIRRAAGYDQREMVFEWDARSMGVSETLLEDVTDYEEIRGLFRILARKLSSRLKAEHKTGSRVQIRICYYNFSNADRSRKLDVNIWKQEDLFREAMALFDENYEEGEAVRLLGLSVSALKADDAAVMQMNLFDDAASSKAETPEILADLNRQLGTRSFVRASSLLKGK